MAVWQAILLGLVQGVTGFIPVSSSGHLNLLSNFMGIQSSINYMILIFLHLGSVLGVFYAFKKDIRRLFQGFFGIFRQLLGNLLEWKRGFKDPENVQYKKLVNTNYARFAFLMLVSLSVTFVVGMILRPLCNALYGSILLNGMGFFMTGLLLIVGSFTPASSKGPRDAKVLDAVIIGLFQGFAIVPGVSLLGMVIATGFICGLTKKFIIKYAYIMSIPVILGSLIFETGSMIASGQDILWIPCLIGMVVAAVTGLILIRFVIRHITTRSCRIFAGYCGLIGCLCIIMYLI